jgi:hypothetical protein
MNEITPIGRKIIPDREQQPRELFLQYILLQLASMAHDAILNAWRQFGETNREISQRKNREHRIAELRQREDQASRVEGQRRKSQLYKKV